MKKVKLTDLKVNDRVYYIADHLEKIPENAEEGYVSTITENRVWVRYKGPQGNLTPLKNLYV